MPRYDLICSNRHVSLDVFARPFEHPPCRTCSAPTDRVWTRAVSVRSDDIPGGLRVEAFGPDAPVFYSHSERLRYARAHGWREKVRFVPQAGTDRDTVNGLTDWSKGSIDPYTLEAARVLAERQAGSKATATESGPPLRWDRIDVRMRK